MRVRDAELDKAIVEVADFLGDALVRLLFPDAANQTVDFQETESPDGTAG